MAFKVINEPGRPVEIISLADKPRKKKTKRVSVTVRAEPKRGPYTGVYPSYLFVDHDPVLDQIDTLIADADMKLTHVAGLAHVAPATLTNWRKRKTKKPQFATVAAVVRAIGGDVVIVNHLSAAIPRRSDT